MLPTCNLPGDVIVNILSRLPVKTLVRFKAVCKPWFDFITSPFFIKLHLKNPNSLHNLLILSDPCDSDASEFSVLTHDEGNPEAHHLFVKITPPFQLDPDEAPHVFDCCNGLVCLGLNIIPDMVLWNPATRQFRFVPLPETRTLGTPLPAVGLGYVEDTCDYKIVMLSQDFKLSERMKVWVYTRSSDSWKKLDLSLANMRLQRRAPVMVNGFLHWLTNRFVSGNAIFSFDVEKEVVSSISVPDNCGSGYGISRQLVVVSGHLSLVVFSESNVMNGSIDIWVMAEYGVEGSWSKQFSFVPLEVGVRPLRSWKDEVLLFRYAEEGSKRLMSYNPFKKIKTYYPDFKSFSFQVINYIESLESVEGSRRAV